MKCKYCGETLSNNDHATRHAGECEVMNGDGVTNVHYVDNFWNGSKPLCGAEFVDAETTAKEAVTCDECLKILKQNRRAELVKELLGGADSV